MIITRTLLGRLAALLCLAAPAAEAATVTYTLTGGPITGTLAGNPFSASGFTITATADTSTIQNGLLATTLPLSVNPVTAYIQLNTSPSPTNLTLMTGPTPGAVMSVWSLEINSEFHYGFGNFTGFDGVLSAHGGLTSTDIVRADLTPYSSSSGTFGTFIAPTYTTDGGILAFDDMTGNTGTFTVGPAPVPEPATATSSLLLSLGGLSLISRRKRKA